MPTFLHLADIHLGFNQYGSAERQKDFYRAFNDIIVRYALPDPVDFIVIAGDFFDNRIVNPATMNQAVAVLSKLKQANIPVIVIEGNHDNKAYDSSANWLSFLAGIEHIILLEPNKGPSSEELIELVPWQAHTRRGSYIDIDGVRVIGARWYGSSSARIIPHFVKAIKKLPPINYTVQLFHAGMEGFINEFAGGLSYEDVLPFREVVNYLALGHFHKHFAIDDWVFNPGSPEACSVTEFDQERGLFRVTVENGQHQIEHLTEFYSRPFRRLRFDLSPYETPEAAEAAVLDELRALKLDANEPPPVVELSLRGQLRFGRHDLDIKKLEQEAGTILNALVVLLKYEAVPVELPVAPEHIGTDRRQLERQVLHDLLSRNARYEDDAENWAKVIAEMKTLALSQKEPDEILAYLQGTERFD